MKLTIPILIEAILHMMLGFVDVFMLSWYNDLAASGVNAANQVITSMVFLVFSSSAGILISRYLGAGQKENASRAAALALTLHLVSGLLIGLLVFLFSGPMLRFIGAEEKAFEFASDYLTLVGVFLFLQSLYSAMSVIIRSHGLTKQLMIFATVMNILNTLLNLLLIPGMGVKGAALATVIGRAAGVVGMACFLFTKVEKPSFFRLLRPCPGRELKQVFKLGIPAAAETFLYQLSQLIITSLVLWYLSENELITKTYMSNIAILFLIFSSAVGQAAQIVVGHLVGAGDFDEAKKTGLPGFPSGCRHRRIRRAAFPGFPGPPYYLLLYLQSGSDPLYRAAVPHRTVSRGRARLQPDHHSLSPRVWRRKVSHAVGHFLQHAHRPGRRSSAGHPMPYGHSRALDRHGAG